MQKYVYYLSSYVPIYIYIHVDALLSAAPVVCNRVHAHTDEYMCGFILHTDTQAVENGAWFHACPCSRF